LRRQSSAKVHALRHDATFPRRRVAPRLLAILGAVATLVFVGVGSLNQTAISATLRHLWGGSDLAIATAATTAPQHSSAQLVHGLQLHLTPPAYAGLRSRTIADSSGAIRALPGTAVELEAFTLRTAHRAALVLRDPAGQETELALDLAEGRVSGRFSVHHDASFRFRLYQRDGTPMDEAIARPITVLEDAPPLVMWHQSQGTLEVSPGESVALRYSASDDYGLQELLLLHSLAGDLADPQQRTLERVSGQLSASGTAQLPLGELNLTPGDLLHVAIEAVDNDDVRGPKRSRTGTLLLRVVGPEERHEALIAQEEALFEALLLLLAEFLEQPILADEPGQRLEATHATEPAEALHLLVTRAAAARNHTERVLALFGEVRRTAQDDPLVLRRDAALLDLLYEELAEGHQGATQAIAQLERLATRQALTRSLVVNFAHQHRIPLTGKVERAIVLLEELIATQWLDAAQATVLAIRETQRRLTQLIERYAAAPDPNQRAEIQREVQRLNQQLDRLLARLNRQMNAVPREHLNPFDDDGQEMENLSADASRLRDLVEAGDLAGALEALAALDAQLDGLLAMTDSRTAPNSAQGLGRLEAETSRVLDRINDLAAEQARLGQDTDQLLQEMRADTTSRLQPLLRQFQRSQGRHLAALRQSLEGVARDFPHAENAAIAEALRSLDTAARVLAEQDVDALHHLLGRAAEAIDQARADNFGAYISQDSDTPASADLLAALDRIRAASRDIDQMRRNNQNLMAAAQPQPDDDQRLDLAAFAAQQVLLRENTEHLHALVEAAGEEFATLRAQLAPEIDIATAFMEDATSALDAATPTEALEAQRQALRTLNAMKRRLQDVVSEERKNQSQSQSPREAIAIPEATFDLHRFRLEVMEAMQDPGLPLYERESARYYKTLVD